MLKPVSIIITSWFAIALDEIRTGRILGEKADCKQSILSQAQLHIIEPNHTFSNCFSLALMHQSIALRAVTTYRAETQTNKLKSIFSEFLTFVVKMRKMAKLRQKLQISHSDVIRALRY